MLHCNNFRLLFDSRYNKNHSTDTNCNSSAGYASTKNGSASIITIDITSLTGLYWIFLSINADRKSYGFYFSNIKLSKT